MSSRSVVTAAALCLLASTPAFAQLGGVTGAAADFWVSVGRFTRANDTKTGKEEPPDLSGHYDVAGVSPGDSGKTYSTTLEMKRWKTLTTPKGAKFNTYRFTYDWDPKVDGIGLLIGKRFYYAYGSDHMTVYVGAPLILTDNETDAYAQYFEVYYKTEYKDNRKYVKNRPWFYNLALDYQRGGYDPAYYFLWISTNGAFGHDIPHIPAWREGKYSSTGTFLQDDGDFQVYKTGMVGRPRYYAEGWELTEQGMNHAVRQIDVNQKVSSGTAMLLEDGVVVMMLGGNDDCGYGYWEVKGNLLTGPYANYAGEHRGTETLKPAADIVAKNAELFGR